MKHLTYVVLIALLSACAPEQKINNADKAEQYTRLLNKYKSVLIDTFRVFSVTNTESSSYKFAGTPLNHSETMLFAPRLTNTDGPGFYACYKFNIDTDRIALITRTPSVYNPSSIKLLIFDRKKLSITDYVELAETWQNGADAMEKVSWLYKNDSGQLRCFQWRRDLHDGGIAGKEDPETRELSACYIIGFDKMKHTILDENAGSLLVEFKERK